MTTISPRKTGPATYLFVLEELRNKLVGRLVRLGAVDLFCFVFSHPSRYLLSFVDFFKSVFSQMGEIFLVPNSGLFRWDHMLNRSRGGSLYFFIIILIRYVLTVWLVSCYNLYLALPWVLINLSYNV